MLFSNNIFSSLSYILESVPHPIVILSNFSITVGFLAPYLHNTSVLDIFHLSYKSFVLPHSTLNSLSSQNFKFYNFFPSLITVTVWECETEVLPGQKSWHSRWRITRWRCLLILGPHESSILLPPLRNLSDYIKIACLKLEFKVLS